MRELTFLLGDIIFAKVPRTEEVLKWRIPFYSCNGWLCYLNPKKDHVEIGFLKGAELQPEFPQLLSEGKVVRRLIIDSSDSTDAELVATILQRTIELNSFKRRKNKRQSFKNSAFLFNYL